MFYILQLFYVTDIKKMTIINMFKLTLTLVLIFKLNNIKTSKTVTLPSKTINVILNVVIVIL